MRAQKVLRNLLSTAAAVTLLTVAAPALAGEPTVSVSGGVVTGRIFADQGFTLTREPVIELGATVCKDGTCVDLWTAQSLVGRSQDHEVDIAVWHDFTSGKFTLQVKAAYFELPGKDVWDGSLTGTYQMNGTCAVAVSYEQMEGGFKEKVLKAKVPCSFALRGGWTATVAPALAHSEAFPGTTGGLELGVTRTFDNGVTLRFYGKGYARDGDRKDGVLGVQLSSSF